MRFCILFSACLRVLLCSTRREYVRVGLTPASMLATVEKTSTRTQSFLRAKFEALAWGIYE